MRGLIYILKYLKHLKQGLVYTKCSVNINYSDNSKGHTTIKVTVTKYLHLIFSKPNTQNHDENTQMNNHSYHDTEPFNIKGIEVVIFF